MSRQLRRFVWSIEDLDFGTDKELCAHGSLTAACHDASCRPPTSGGTGGSSRSGGVAFQHLTSPEGAKGILSEGFKLTTEHWARQFGEGVYLSHEGDTKAAKFYANQGGREWNSAEVVHGTAHLENPLNVKGDTMWAIRKSMERELGGPEAVKTAAQDIYDRNAIIVRRVLTEELGTDNPEALKRLDLTHPDTQFYWDFNPSVFAKVEERLAKEMDPEINPKLMGFGLGPYRALVDHYDRIMAKPKSRAIYDQESSYTEQLAHIARTQGHDGIVIDTTRWGSIGGKQLVVFDPSKIVVQGAHPYAQQQGVTASGEEFACHDASCRPPTSGGTGGSRRRAGFSGMSAPRERGDQRPNPRFLQLTKSTMDDEGVGWEDLSTKKRSEKFVASWYEAELPNGFSTKVKATRLSDTHFEVEGTIHNEFGRQVGTFERTVKFDDMTSYEVWGDNGYGTDTTIRKHLYGTTVEHTSLIIDSSAQGQGIADALNAHAMKAYQQNGVDNIKVIAGYDVGGYTWAVAGFRIDDGMPNAFGEFRKDTRHVMIDWMLSEGADKASRLVQDGKLTAKQGDDAIKQIEALRKASKAGEDIQPIHIASLGENTHKFKNESNSFGPLTTWLGKEIMLGKNWGGYYYLTKEPITASVTIGFGQEFTMTEHTHIPQEEGDINATRDWTEIHEQVAEYLAKYGQTA